MACDVCNILEYNSQQNGTYFGVFYRVRHFQSYPHLSQQPRMRGFATKHEPENSGMQVFKSAADYETYTSLELRANFALGQRWNLLLILPYEQNTVYYRNVLPSPTRPQRDTTLSVSGLGDAIVGLDYLIRLGEGKVRHRLKPGLGFRVPVGQATRSAGSGQPFDPLLQPGTGAWAALFRLNHQWLLNRWRLYSAVSYQTSGQGAQRFRFGDSFNWDSRLARQFSRGADWKLRPQVGADWESYAPHQQGGADVPLTGGEALFGQVGLDINCKAVTLQILGQHPVWQRLRGAQIANSSRWSVGLIWAMPQGFSLTAE